MNGELSSGYRVIQTNPAIGERGLIHVYGSDASTPSPYLLGIHGGGGINGDQTSFAWMWQRMKILGFPLVLPSYRLRPEFRFPCAYDDLVHLLAWLRENGKSHGLAPSRCLLFGGSAGGYLAMLLATRAMKENRPMPDIAGVVNYCGVMDMAAQYAFEVGRGRSMVKDFLDALPESNPSLYRDASPICHIHDRMPPVWMAHGTTDGTVSVSQSRKMALDLVAAGYDPIYLEARGVGHSMVDVEPNGKLVEPIKLLFEEDFHRFIQRTMA